MKKNNEEKNEIIQTIEKLSQELEELNASLVQKEEIRNELDVNRRKRLFEKIIEIKRGCVENNEE